MVDSKDELFCRLAIRLGHLNREDAIQIIKSYRSDGAVGQGIGNFVVEEGWLEADAVAQIEDAIAARAPGHVSSARRRVPKVGKGKGGKKGGKHPVVHHHHVDAYPRKVNANGLQVAVIGIGAVVLLGSVVFLILQFQKSDSKTTSEQLKETVQAREESSEAVREKNRAAKGKPAKASAQEPAKVMTLADMPAQERENLESSVRDHIFTSGGWDDLEPYKAVTYIQEKKEELKDIPEELLAKFDERLDELKVLVKSMYEDELLDQLLSAKKGGDEDEVNGILADIKTACGPEYYELAKKAIE